ncbi:uncharacterized protein BJ212DRAFT_1367672, partial [Suillus subaureus]
MISEIIYMHESSDIKITPNDSTNLGSGMLDHPVARFFMEYVHFLGGLCVYTTFAPIAARVRGIRRDYGALLRSYFVQQV